MDSTPQATATSTTPPATRAVARLVACWDEPHCVSTVVAATSMGRPAVSHAVRVMLKDCSPTWLTQPPTTWPTSAGSIPVRSTSSASTVASRSAGCTRGQAAVAAADGGADGVDDHDVGHGAHPRDADGPRVAAAGRRRVSTGCIAATAASLQRRRALGRGGQRAASARWRELVVAAGRRRLASRAGARWLAPGQAALCVGQPLRGPTCLVCGIERDRRGCAGPALRSSGRVAVSWSPVCGGGVTAGQRESPFPGARSAAGAAVSRVRPERRAARAAQPRRSAPGRAAVRRRGGAVGDLHAHRQPVDLPDRDRTATGCRRCCRGSSGRRCSPGPPCWSPTRVFRPISAGKATSGLVARDDEVHLVEGGGDGLVGRGAGLLGPCRHVEASSCLSAMRRPKAISLVRSPRTSGQWSAEVGAAARPGCPWPTRSPGRGRRGRAPRARRPASRARASAASRTRSATVG